MPQISVIMPIYNTNPDHLRQAVASILTQTFTDFEFIILNDSPKNLELDQVIETFHDDRIRYIKADKNLGIAESHNKLLALATGRYIAIMDHDDISLPDRLKKQYEYLETHPDVGICGTAYRRFGRISKIKTVYHPQEHDEIQAMLLFSCPIHHPSCMIRKSVLEQNHICYDKRFISLNDRKLYWDIAHHAKLHNLQDVLYQYRMHPMMTSKVRRQEIMNEQLVYREILLDKYGIKLSDKEKNILNTYVLNGRCRITSKLILQEIKDVLEKLICENQHLHFSDPKVLRRVCASYLVRRCKNAALRGGIPSKHILAKTTLPVKPPMWLKLFNFIRGCA